MSLIPGASLIILATTTVAIGAKVAAAREEQNLETDEFVEINCTQVILMPVCSSISLLVLFFFFDYAQLFLLLITVAGSVYILFDLCYNAIQSIRPTLNWKLNMLLAVVFSGIVFVEWLKSNYIAHDILGCAMCITLIGILRFPSLKIAFLSLCLLVVYDIFWVFYSEYFFNANVMTTVATKQASNPVQSFGSHYNIQTLKALKPTVELPMKLMVPAEGSHYSMLGLGDIALPGLLVALALRSDKLLKQELPTAVESGKFDNLGLLPDLGQNKFPKNIKVGEFYFFELSLAGYFFGMIMAFYANKVTKLAQPALIYLVPGVLIPFVLRAFQKGKLAEVWAGPKQEAAKS